MPTQSVFSKATRADRLDKIMPALFNEMTRSAAQKLIEQELVRVNGEIQTANYRVNVGDDIQVRTPEPEVALPQPEDIALNVLYEDDDLIAINKPVGMVVHPAAGNKSGTVVNALLAHAPQASTAGDEDRPGIVHRLDKETSGVMLLAKTDAAYKDLQMQFKQRTIHKTYIAVCVGQVQPVRGTINKPIARDPANRLRMAVLKGGREAQTDFAVSEVFALGHAIRVMEVQLSKGSAYTVVRAQPHTGRTHQVRVHFASIGFPIAGDALYGATRHDTLSKAIAPRHLLHASELELELPSSRKAIKLFAPIPEDMSRVIAELRVVNGE